MKRSLFLLFLTLISAISIAQPAIRQKKYTSLLWEISGNGMKKPSYLIGTMHVSSKLAFNLPDSFYIAVKNAQVVALETNPETWQEDMNKYDLGMDISGYAGYSSMPSDYLNINTLKFFKYSTKIERALYSNPSTINNLLYRTYGGEASDFEEDTYLDMYIYQVGKKWGKRVAGVENYGESMKLMAEAYRDAAKDKNRKQRSYGSDEDYSLEKLQEAYRMGNLDVLDSINRYNSVSSAFDEKFLYERNRIQAVSIDSILKTGSSLFVGVGAAHLPGERGVIEMLRRMGYRLRPIRMGERASRQKDLVEKIRVPVTFKSHTSEDGFYKVDIPGKMFKQGEDNSLVQYQYADMANGSYYMVTRIMTNAWMWDHTSDKVYQAVDSLLYENVPGKIISRNTITKNGYRGFDILNRTRRGDLQRYNIFITPFEVLFFKMSGNGDYVSAGDEASKFFNSIQLKEYIPVTGTASPTWKKFTPAYGGFTVDMPHDPYVGNDGSWIFDASDRNSGVHYRVIRTDVHNLSFVGEDSFDLRLMEESFSASEFIDTLISRRAFVFKGYPALETKYRAKNGRIFNSRFIIQGPHYYTLIAGNGKEGGIDNRFFDSFTISPYKYRAAKMETDTMLYFTVKTPVFAASDKISLGIKATDYYGYAEGEEQSEGEILEAGTFRNRIIANDSTGEKIYVTFYRYPRYFHTSDSIFNNKVTYMGDSTWIVRWREQKRYPNGLQTSEALISDTASSRVLHGKAFYRNGIQVTVVSQTDTLSAPSDFIRSFYETFTPSDTVTGTNPFVKKSAVFFADFQSTDSVIHKRAVKNIGAVELDSTDLSQLISLVKNLNWEERNYLETRKALINKFGSIKTKQATDYLKSLYYALDDTIQLQYPVLENILQQKTVYSYNAFKDIINTEPPVLPTSQQDYLVNRLTSPVNYDYATTYDSQDGNFMDELYDSLALVKNILPDLLPLVNLDDYKRNIMTLLGNLVDSNMIQPSAYSIYFEKFLIEAKQELRKQAIAEKRKAINKAEQDKKGTVVNPYETEVSDDDGNEDLSLYAVLLQPFWNTKPAVQPLLTQMLSSSDSRLKYSTLLLMIRSKRPYRDTLLTWFASKDNYRYELYRDLKTLKRSELFPARYASHTDLGKSSLIFQQSYSKPDSISYLSRIQTRLHNRDGYVYFFRYRESKDDAIWKIAVAGLTPLREDMYEFADDSTSKKPKEIEYFPYTPANLYRYELTEFTKTKIKEDEPLQPQLEKELKRILYGRKNSGREFFRDNTNLYGDSEY